MSKTVALIILVTYQLSCTNPQSLDRDATNLPLLNKLFQVCSELRSEDYPQSYRYHNGTKKCFNAAGSIDSPCGENMAFFAEEDVNNIYGYCDCNNDLCNTKGRLLIFHPGTNRCYHVYKQGYCPNGYMLTLHPITMQPQCVFNPCQSQLITDSWKGHHRFKHQQHCQDSNDVVWFHNRCVQLYTWQPECGRDEFVQFNYYEGSRDFVDPVCGKGCVSCGGFGVITQTNKCSTGSVRSITGKCVKSWKWA